MGSSLSNILPSVLGGVASLIPGVGAIAGPLVGGIASDVFGGGGSGPSASDPYATGGSSAAPYNVQNSLANLAQMIGPASAAMQTAQSNQKLANSLQNSALTSEGTQTTNAQNNLRALYQQFASPADRYLNVSQVSPQSISSVLGPGQGRLPQIYSPQPTPYATQVAQMTAPPSGQQSAAPPPTPPPTAPLPVTTSAPTAAPTPALTLNASYGQGPGGGYDYNGESQLGNLATNYFPTEAAAQSAWFAANPQYASLAPGGAAAPNSTVINAPPPPSSSPLPTARRMPQNFRAMYGAAA